MAWLFFCKINCVHLASCVTKYSPWQVRGDWRKYHSVGTQILISNRPSSAATVGDSPLSSLPSCSVWACFLSQAADLRGQPCLSLLFMTGAQGLWRLRSTVIHRAHNFHWEKLRYIYLGLHTKASQILIRQAWFLSFQWLLWPILAWDDKVPHCPPKGKNP